MQRPDDIEQGVHVSSINVADATCRDAVDVSKDASEAIVSDKLLRAPDRLIKIAISLIIVG